MYEFWLRFPWSLFRRIQCTIPHQWLSPVRRQTFIRTNDDLVYWRIYASLGLKELKVPVPQTCTWLIINATANVLTHDRHQERLVLLKKLRDSGVPWEDGLWCKMLLEGRGSVVGLTKANFGRSIRTLLFLFIFQIKTCLFRNFCVQCHTHFRGFYENCYPLMYHSVNRILYHIHDDDDHHHDHDDDEHY